MELSRLDPGKTITEKESQKAGLEGELGTAFGRFLGVDECTCKFHQIHDGCNFRRAPPKSEGGQSEAEKFDV